MKANGCRLLQSTLDPLKDGINSILIARKSNHRENESFLQIRTNKLEYQCDNVLKQELQNSTSTLVREIGTEFEKTINKNQDKTNEFSLTISNDKDKDVVLRIEAEINIYGSNESVDLYLFACREEELVQLSKIHILNWNNWLNNTLYYDADIPFYKNSPITIKAGFYNWTGGAIDLNTTNITIKCRY